MILNEIRGKPPDARALADEPEEAPVRKRGSYLQR
jgi:hypothetical protein